MMVTPTVRTSLRLHDLTRKKFALFLQQPPSAAALAAPQYMPCQQPQKTVPQPLMVSPSLMLFAQQQQQQQQEQQKMALYSQLMPSSGVNSEFSVPNAGGTEPRVYLKGREAERN